MDIRPYAYKYYQNILDLDTEAMLDFSDNKLPVNANVDLQKIDEYYDNTNGSLFVGILNNEVIAMGGFRFIDKATAELKRMRVRKSLRGSGLGTQMLLFLESKLQGLGISKIILETASSRNLTLQFYKKNGYRFASESNYGTIPVTKYYKLI